MSTATNGNRHARRAAKSQEPETEAPAQEQDISKMSFVVHGPVLQATVSYLATRPYQEVFQILHALQQSKPVESND